MLLPVTQTVTRRGNRLTTLLKTIAGNQSVMDKASWNFAEVRFIDRDQVIRGLRQAVAKAKAKYPEIVKVLLFGPFVQGTWTADSDADLFVVVRKEFADIFGRGQ